MAITVQRQGSIMTDTRYPYCCYCNRTYVEVNYNYIQRVLEIECNVSAVKQYVYGVDKSEKMGTKIVLSVSMTP